MSYHTYTTEAFVCGVYDRGPSSRSIKLFTRDLGMLYAEAKSVREERSRQRYALQLFSELRVSLIRGKAGWRVGSVEPLGNHFSLAENRQVRVSVLRLTQLLNRFIQGEEPGGEVFRIYQEALILLPQTDDVEWLEAFVSVRLLAQLGYVDEGELPVIAFKVPLSEADLCKGELPLSVLQHTAEAASHHSHL
jgi:DNA repair protein RecO